MRRPFVTLLALVASLVPLVDGIRPAAAVQSSRSGYWMLSSDGEVYPFGGAADHGDQVAVLRANPSFHGSPVKHHESVDLEPSPSGAGYWILTNTGMIDAYGDARGRVFIDRLPSLDGGEEATSLSASPSGNGLWVFTNRGRVVAYGDARHFGDMARTALNGPVLDAVPTTSGLGYFMVGSDGGIFAFGDAAFAGSMGGQKLNAPVQSLVPASDGKGYWLVASDGGIFAFGAPFKGSMGGTKLNKPVTGMVRAGSGYLMVGEDGGIFNFSGQPFAGSLGDQPPSRPIVAVAAFEASVLKTATPGDTGEVSSPQPTTTTTFAPATTTTPVSPDPPDLAPTHVLPCADGSGATALVWYYDRNLDAESWAADNRCTDQWIIVDLPGDSESDPYGRVLSVAPGTQFRLPVDGWTSDSPGNEHIGLAADRFTGCSTGYGVWEVRPDTGGTFELIRSCPGVDDEEEPEYQGPRCFGLVPDYIGTDGDDELPNIGEDRNGDGEVTIHGLGGNDTWSNGGFDSGTFTDTYLCGGEGDDLADGWLGAFDGGEGNDTLWPSACGSPAAVHSVEVVHPEAECPDDIP